jgi:hypothetical protein
MKAYSRRASRASIVGELGLTIFVRSRHRATGKNWRLHGFTYVLSEVPGFQSFDSFDPSTSKGMDRPAFFELEMEIYNQRHTGYYRSHVLRNLPFRYACRHGLDS